MSGGPLPPISVVPATTRIFPYTYGSVIEGLGVNASLAGDAIWRLIYAMPPDIPTGTLKLWSEMLANATSGSAKINVKWVMVSTGSNIVTAAPVAEGVGTYTWGAGDNDKMKQLLVTLDVNSAPTGKQFMKVDLTFETSGWTLAQILALSIPKLIWE